jgi:hypothetical protein
MTVVRSSVKAIRSPVLTAETWQKALAIAAPEIAPRSKKGMAAKGRAEAAARILRTGTYYTESNGMSFRDIATAGRVFLEGLEVFEEMYFQLASLEDKDLENPQRTVFTFAPNLKEQIAKVIMLVEGAEAIFDNALTDAPPEKHGNVKTSLHIAVGMLWSLWLELTGGARTKLEFYAFAHTILEDARSGVTENSVIQTFRRHVAPALRRRHN